MSRTLCRWLDHSKWLVIGACLVSIALTSLWAQSGQPEKPAPPQEKKAEKEAAPKKKMKKVHTLFGDSWVEDTGQPDTPPASPEAASAPPPSQPPQPAAPAKSEPGAAKSSENEKSSPKAEAGPPPAPEPKADQAPSSASAMQPPVSGASLVFNNADLVQVVQVIANLLHLNYVLDPAVKGSVTVTTLGDISSADLMQILQTLLRINGATAIKSGNLWQIVPLKSAHQIPTPIETPGGKPLSPDDQLVTEIVPLQFVSAADMSKILKEFLSDAGSIVSHDRGNILVMTDASRNMARLLELIRTFDSDALANQRVRLFTVKNNAARAMIDDLKNIFSAYALSEKDSAVRFVPIDRLNAILVVAPNPATFDTVAQWIDKLDQPSQVAGIRNYVYHVQYAKADDIRKLLGELYGSIITTGTPGAPRNEPLAAVPPSTVGLSTSTVLAQPARPEQAQQREVYGFQGNIKVVADTVNNMLIIQATPQDYDLIEQTLRQIDVLPRQVLIEAQIFRVDLSQDFSLGVEYSLQQRGTAGPNRRPLANVTGGTFSGSSVILAAGARELFAKVTATENRSRTKTLSSPSIMTTDNQEARIQVGVSIPTLSSSGFAPTGNNTIFNTIQNVDTGVILTVTPRVGANGMVGLKVNQEVSTPVPPPAGVPNLSPSINRSTASTNFVVKDGETVAIAGIITEDKELTRSRVPGLGDIPILGAAFGNTKTINKRSELIIFITPHVIETLDQETIVTDSLRQEMKKLKKDLNSNEKSRRKIWEHVPTTSSEPK